MEGTVASLLKRYLGNSQVLAPVTAEQFRILHARIEQIQKETDQNIFCVTSAVKGEGKSFTAMHLALTMATDFEKKTLLMDLDCRKSLFQKLNGKEKVNPIGWADIIQKKVGIDKAMIPLIQGRFFMLPVGKPVPSSSHLITTLGASGLLKELKKQFDCILLDAPPILPLVDVKLLEDMVDGIILVVRARKTTRDVVMKAYQSIRRGKVLGLVLNDVKASPKNYYYYYNHQQP